MTTPASQHTLEHQPPHRHHRHRKPTILRGFSSILRSLGFIRPRHGAKGHLDLIQDMESAVSHELDKMLELKRRDVPFLLKELDAIRASYDSVKSAREDLLATLKGKDMKSRDRAVKLYTQRCEAFILMVQIISNDARSRKLFASWYREGSHKESTNEKEHTILVSMGLDSH